MNIITIPIKLDMLDMSYDFYIRHNIHAVEWKLNNLNNQKQKFDQ